MSRKIVIAVVDRGVVYLFVKGVQREALKPRKGRERSNLRASLTISDLYSSWNRLKQTAL